MKNIIVPCIFLLCLVSLNSFKNISSNTIEPTRNNIGIKDCTTLVGANLYDSLHLDNLGLSRQAFNCALQGYNELLQKDKLANANVLSIVDLSLPSSVKRLFVVDMANFKLLFNTYVSHGRNSGLQTAERFSNNPESFKSSLGFYSTASTYMGKHGYSLQLDGLEKGFNDNAKSRGIVVHAAEYVNENMAKCQGYIGRSLGCPALPQQLSAAIIKTIANGSCLFMYANDNGYLQHSTFLQNRNGLTKIFA